MYCCLLHFQHVLEHFIILVSTFYIIHIHKLSIMWNISFYYLSQSCFMRSCAIMRRKCCPAQNKKKEEEDRLFAQSEATSECMLRDCCQQKKLENVVGDGRYLTGFRNYSM